MNKVFFKNNKNTFAALAFIAIFVIVFGFALHAIAAAAPGETATTNLAATPWWSGGMKYVVAGFGALGVVIMQIIGAFAYLIGLLFDFAIDQNMAFGINMPVITIGWTIARDVANIFFILVLLTIAIMTILRISSYQAKTMFFKFVVIALLINFSLSFGLILIDFTNILGKGFYDAMRPGGQSISTTIINGTNIQNIWNLQPASAASQQSFFDTVLGSLPLGLGALYNSTKGFIGLATLSFEQAVAFAKIAWGNTIILAIMIFVMLVASIFLIIRVAVLAILLVVSPIAFIAMILPKAEHIWQKWWSTFFSHAFFFPAFLFLMYFSVLFVTRITKLAPAANFMDSPPLFIGYVVAVVMMIGALIIAKQMGVYGADAVMKTATTGRQWVAGYVGMQTIGRLGEKLQQNKTVQSTRVGRQFSAAMANTGAKTAHSRVQVGEEKAQWLAKQAAGKDSSDWINGMKALGGSGREKFIQSIPEQARGKFMADLKKSDPAMYDATMNTLKVRLGAKQLKDFEKAEMQDGLKNQRGAAMGTYVDGMNEDEQKKNFKAMTDSQRTDLLEAWHGDSAKLGKIQGWKETELDLEEQDKFTQNVLKRSSNAALGNYMNKLKTDNRPVEIENILSKLSSQQQVQLWNNAFKGGAESLKNFDEMMGRMSADIQANYHKAFAPMLQSKSAKDAAPMWTSLPPEVQQSMGSAAPEKVKSIYYTKLATPQESTQMRESIIKTIQESGSADKYTRQGSTDAGLWKQRLGGPPPKIVIKDHTPPTPPPTPPPPPPKQQPPPSGPTIIMPSQGFGGGPKTSGTSGQSPPPSAEDNKK